MFSGCGRAAGVLVTAAVRYSSAVIVATIGFVNAGLLNLSQAARPTTFLQQRFRSAD